MASGAGSTVAVCVVKFGWKDKRVMKQVAVSAAWSGTSGLSVHTALVALPQTHVGHPSQGVTNKNYRQGTGPFCPIRPVHKSFTGNGKI